MVTSNRQHMVEPSQPGKTQVDYMGGDGQPCDKDHTTDDVMEYKAGLRDMVRAISVLHCLGIKPNNFETIDPSM